MHRKYTVPILALVLALLLGGCAAAPAEAEEMSLAATTYPVWQFTCAVVEGTELTVERVITEPVSCLHDYSLSVAQMKALARSSVVIISGLGLEEFMQDALSQAALVIDASAGVQTLCTEAHAHEEHEEHEEHEAHEGHAHEETAVHAHHGHDHGENDPHIWLDPARAAQMTQNICAALSEQYPQYRAQFAENTARYCARLDALAEEITDGLSALSERTLVTFHDGFSYFAEAFDLTIAAAMEVEAGSEVPARELEQIARLVTALALPAVFVESSGDTAAATIIAGETGARVETLDMCMGELDYFSAMRQNLNAIKGALE